MSYEVLAFYVVLGVFAIIALFSAIRIKNLDQFFNHPNPNQRILPTILGNFSLATGVFFVFDGVGRFSYLFLLVPISTVVSYWLLWRLSQKLLSERKGNRHVLYENVGKAGIWGPPVFLGGLLLMQLIAYPGLIAAEIFFTSTPISLFVFGEVEWGSYAIAALILVVACIYTAIGGIQAVARSEWAQAVGVLMLMGLLSYIVIDAASLQSLQTQDVERNSITSPIKPDLNVALIVALVAVVLAPIFTRFYSVVDLNIAGESRINETSSTDFRLIGFGLGFLYLWLSIIVLYYLFSTGNSASLISLLQNYTSEPGFWANIVGIVFILGATSAVISTVDSFILAISKGLTYARGTLSGEPNGVSSKHVLLGSAVVVGISAIVGGYLYVLFAVNASVIPILLTSTIGMAVMAPFAVEAALARHARRQAIVDYLVAAVVVAFAAAFAWIWVAYSVIAGNENKAFQIALAFQTSAVAVCVLPWVWRKMLWVWRKMLER